MANKAYLILADGSIFEGESVGCEGTTIGELVFTTGMTGYLETLTDPSYYGQIIMQTFPLIGNYGIIPEDKESPRVCGKGYVVREWCAEPSNFRMQGDVNSFLKSENVVGICGIDTREVTLRIREQGVMNAKITTDETQVNTDGLADYAIVNAVSNTCMTTSAHEIYNGNGQYSVAILDLGAKANIARCLISRGVSVSVLPYDSTAQDIIDGGYDGLMLTNGAGNPEENTSIIATIRSLIGKLPIFGICLGHQLLALANGGKTYKLKYGHRGANQPVKELRTGNVHITSQNHGYAVDAASLPKFAEVTYINANDGTVEGINYKGKQCFSVQYHPEAAGGPLDNRYLFDLFLNMMTK